MLTGSLFIQSSSIRLLSRARGCGYPSSPSLVCFVLFLVFAVMSARWGKKDRSFISQKLCVKMLLLLLWVLMAAVWPLSPGHLLLDAPCSVSCLRVTPSLVVLCLLTVARPCPCPSPSWPPPGPARRRRPSAWTAGAPRTLSGPPSSPRSRPPRAPPPPRPGRPP